MAKTLLDNRHTAVEEIIDYRH